MLSLRTLKLVPPATQKNSSMFLGDFLLQQKKYIKLYTHFPDDFMYEQMQSVKFPLPKTA